MRTNYNSGESALVDRIKSKSAELYDLVESIKSVDPWLADKAQTHIKTASMFAVDLATTRMGDLIPKLDSIDKAIRDGLNGDIDEIAKPVEQPREHL